MEKLVEGTCACFITSAINAKLWLIDSIVLFTLVMASDISLLMSVEQVRLSVRRKSISDDLKKNPDLW